MALIWNHVENLFPFFKLCELNSTLLLLLMTSEGPSQYCRFRIIYNYFNVFAVWMPTTNYKKPLRWWWRWRRYTIVFDGIFIVQNIYSHCLCYESKFLINLLMLIITNDYLFIRINLPKHKNIHRNEMNVRLLDLFVLLFKTNVTTTSHLATRNSNINTCKRCCFVFVFLRKHFVGILDCLRMVYEWSVWYGSLFWIKCLHVVSIFSQYRHFIRENLSRKLLWSLTSQGSTT